MLGQLLQVNCWVLQKGRLSALTTGVGLGTQKAVDLDYLMGNWLETCSVLGLVDQLGAHLDLCWVGEMAVMLDLPKALGLELASVNYSGVGLDSCWVGTMETSSGHLKVKLLDVCLVLGKEMMLD